MADSFERVVRAVLNKPERVDVDSEGDEDEPAPRNWASGKRPVPAMAQGVTAWLARSAWIFGTTRRRRSRGSCKSGRAEEEGEMKKLVS
jgi:hypothetical protein